MTTRLPAEWAPQRGVILTWPHPGTDWAAMLAAIEDCYDRLALEIAAREPLIVVCADPAHQAHIRGRLAARGADLGNVSFYALPSNDTWVRDYGPLTVHGDSGPLLLDFTFDGWNRRFDAALDDRVSHGLHRAGALGRAPLKAMEVILEGGAVDSDGNGLLLTTTRCLLNRANGIDRGGYETLFRRQLGVTKVLWLEHGELTGDDTDSHVDMLARFCPGGVIAHTAPAAAGDPDGNALEAMAVQLATLVETTPELTGLVPLPRPAPIRDEDGELLPASYANFLVINDAVLVPTYDDPADATALAALAGCFPDREVVGVPSRALIHQHGSLHCATMHLPA